MQNVVHFGAGNIGRGFIGNLLSRSGYRVVFADINKTIIPELQERQGYTVEEVGATRREIEVAPVTGLFSDDPQLIEAIAQVPLITTAVGPGVLKVIAGTIAAGLRRRVEAGNTEPLNIIACENMTGGSSALRSAVMETLDGETATRIAETVGFPDSAVDRIIPPMYISPDPLLVRVEEFSEWIVDRTAFVGEVPAIEGMVLTDNLEAYIERKLFTLNTGHAVTAYLGALNRYRTIGESIGDPRISEVVQGAMVESGEVLIRRYGFERAAHGEYIQRILQRFHNPFLVDEVERVGREPLRKLSSGDRLIKPLRGTLEYSLPHRNLVAGIAAAFAFDDRRDPQTVELRGRLATQGLSATVMEVTGLGEGPGEREVVGEIVHGCEGIAARTQVESFVRHRTHIVTIHEAAAQFSSLVAEAIAGGEVIVADQGRPVVRLTPVAPAV